MRFFRTIKLLIGKTVMAMMMLPRYRNQTVADLQHLVLEPVIRDRIAIIDVTPAKAGAQLNRAQRSGVPAFAGMTNDRFAIKAGTDFSKTPDDISLAGGMRIVNWEVTASEWGLPLAGAEAGSLGMKFKMANPALALLSMLPPIGGMDPKTFVFLDKAFYFADAVYRFGKGMLWSAEGELDPLILDLDGDGIETLDRGSSGLRFDHNVDLFSETSGWLSGDDGFLVLDENKNGLIDNGTEMFGGNGVSGLGELATHDSNGDGKITVADVIWSELRVWRDLDEDAVTDDGELFTLDAVGISGINLQATANDNKALALTRAA
jgi:hypothetical protein